MKEIAIFFTIYVLLPIFINCTIGYGLAILSLYVWKKNDSLSSLSIPTHELKFLQCKEYSLSVRILSMLLWPCQTFFNDGGGTKTRTPSGDTIKDYVVIIVVLGLTSKFIINPIVLIAIIIGYIFNRIIICPVHWIALSLLQIAEKVATHSLQIAEKVATQSNIPTKESE